MVGTRGAREEEEGEEATEAPPALRGSWAADDDAREPGPRAVGALLLV
jgi:hypothetical protein